MNKTPGLRFGHVVAYSSLVVAVVALSTAIASTSWYFSNQYKVLLSAQRVLDREAGLVSERLDGTLRAVSIVLEELAADGAAARRSPERLRDHIPLVPEATDLLFLDAEGRTISNASGVPSPADFDSPAFERLRRGAGFEVDSLGSYLSYGRVLVVLRRLEGPGSRFAGAAAAVIGSRALDEALSAYLNETMEYAAVAGPDGTVALAKSWNQPRSRGLGAGIDRDPSLLYGTARMRSFPLDAVVAEDRSAHLADFRRDFLLFLTVSLLAALLFGAVSAYSFASLRALGRADGMRRELERRESLYREVNHRIKNDLQVVRSILYFGMDRAGADTEASEALQAAENRIASISLVHEQLYRRVGLAASDLGDYIKDLGAFLKDAYAADRPLELRCESDEGLSVSMDSAVSCGLILNELTTNAFKYAFPDGRAGTIILSARRSDDGGLAIKVVDDGVGFSVEEAKKKETSFGMTLVRSLAQQLKADVSVETGAGQGTAWTVLLPPWVISS